MIYSGLTSVTFRTLTPAAIVDLAVRAGVQGIEWGGDVHVPPSDPANAAAVRQLSQDHGLRVSSYGSYYRVGRDAQTRCEFGAVLDAAIELRAPVIRVWAGDCGSREASAEQWAAVVDDSARIAAMAGQEGIRVAYEFHERTLADTPEAVKRLIERADHPSIRTYWQPPVGEEPGTCVQGLRAIVPWLDNVHVFHYVGPQQSALVDGSAPWRTYFAEMATQRTDCYALIEFVRNDDPAQFLQDAAVLEGLLDEANRAASGA